MFRATKNLHFPRECGRGMKALPWRSWRLACPPQHLQRRGGESPAHGHEGVLFRAFEVFQSHKSSPHNGMAAGHDLMLVLPWSFTSNRFELVEETGKVIKTT
jgi:hypothetical protein